MNKEIVKRISSSDIRIVIRDNYVHINDSWNSFEGRFHIDDINNFIIWLDYASNAGSVGKCLDMNTRFFKHQRDTFGNYIASERIQYIKDILESMPNNKLYETVLDIKDDTKLLKDVLNHASLWELDDIYSRIKVKKGELQ